MSVLRNPKHEKFAQALAQGRTQLEAYVEAGYNFHGGNASALANKPDVVSRVAELQQRIADIQERATSKAMTVLVDKYAVSKERVLSELARLAFSNMMDYIRVGPDGQPYCDFSALDRDQAAAIVQVNVEMTTATEVNEAGDRVPVQIRKATFRLADKRAALVDLGKHVGLFKEQVEHTIKADTADELLRQVHDHFVAIGMTPPPELLPVGVANRKGTTH